MREGDSYVTLTECRLCAATLPAEPLFDMGLVPLANALPKQSGPQPAYPLALTQCSVCRHVQLQHAVNPELLYPADYIYESGLSETFRRHLCSLAQDVSELIPTGSRVLEIGSNDGTLLKALRDLGHDVAGVEPAHYLAAAACLDGIPTYSQPWNLESARAILKTIERSAARRPQCIVATNVMAHTPSSREFVAGVAEVLPDGGLFVFENGYWPAIVESNAFPVIYAEHLDQYALRPLWKFFDRYGLSLYDAERIDAQGGSIRGYVRKGLCPISKRLGKLLDEEAAAETSVVTFRGRAWQAADAIANTVRTLPNPSSLAVYGAPARLAGLMALVGTLLPHGLTPYVRFVVDDSPIKIGRYDASGQFPIVSPDALYDNPAPDAVLVAAWPYEAEIRERHRGFRGKWIIPFPEVRVV